MQISSESQKWKSLLVFTIWCKWISDFLKFMRRFLWKMEWSGGLMVSNMRKCLAIQNVYRVIPWDSQRKLFQGETPTAVPYSLWTVHLWGCSYSRRSLPSACRMHRMYQVFNLLKWALCPLKCIISSKLNVLSLKKGTCLRQTLKSKRSFKEGVV